MPKGEEETGENFSTKLPSIPEALMSEYVAATYSGDGGVLNGDDMDGNADANETGRRDASAFAACGEPK